MRRDAHMAVAFGLRNDFAELCLDEIADRGLCCLPSRGDSDLWLYWFERREDSLALFCSDGLGRNCVSTGDGFLCERGLPRLLRERVYERTGLREEPLIPPPGQWKPAILVVHHAPYALAALRSFEATWADIRGRGLRRWRSEQHEMFVALDRAA